jgi:uncharacterized protein YceK
MKSKLSLMIASLLLASGCTTMDVTGGSDYGFSHNQDAGILQQLADNSQGA